MRPDLMTCPMDQFMDALNEIDTSTAPHISKEEILASLLDSMYDPDNIEGYVSRVKRAAVARRVADGLEKMRLERARRMAS